MNGDKPQGRMSEAEGGDRTFPRPLTAAQNHVAENAMVEIRGVSCSPESSIPFTTTLESSTHKAEESNLLSKKGFVGAAPTAKAYRNATESQTKGRKDVYTRFPHLTILLALCGAVFLGAAGGLVAYFLVTNGQTCDYGNWETNTTAEMALQVSVTVYKVSSSLAALHSQSSEDEIREWIKGATKVWNQANIEISIQDLTLDHAQNEESYEDLVADYEEGRVAQEEYLQQTAKVVAATRSHESRQTEDWKLFIVHDLPMCGFAFSNTEDKRGVLYVREKACAHVKSPPSISARSVIIAHELGHTLSLSHDTQDQCNLMAAFDPGVILSSRQISSARAVARTGQAYVGARMRRYLRLNRQNRSSGAPELQHIHIYGSEGYHP